MASRVGSVHGAVGIWLDYSKASKSFGSSDFRALRCSYTLTCLSPVFCHCAEPPCNAIRAILAPHPL